MSSTAGAATQRPVIAGYRCVSCGATVDIAEPLPFRCPNASGGDRHHLLRIVSSIAPLRAVDDPNPFIAFAPYLAWRSFARAHGMSDAACDALTRELDAAVAHVDGASALAFRWTPFGRSAALSDALGFSAEGGVWVKDETGNVSGSHKARHLFGTMLQLQAAEVLGVAPWAGRARPALAIASCGNAALAAATIAAAASWPIEVLVPAGANVHVVERLGALGAGVVTCARRHDDPPGDPCVLRFRETVAAGALPFSVQGPENALCLDGGRTIGWELALQHERDPQATHPIDQLFVQVGGGALATCAWTGVRDQGTAVRLHAVQTAACAPLARAWERAVSIGPTRAAARWGECMWPWEHVGESAAGGILDDETYDWPGVVTAMAAGGSPVVVDEALVLRANELAGASTGSPVDPTGSAGLAGLLALRDRDRDLDRDLDQDRARARASGPSGGVGDDETVVVIFSGRRR